MSGLKKIVIKLGTSTLTKGTLNLSRPAMLEVARQVSELHGRGVEIVLVTSGALSAGREVIPEYKQDKSVPSKQMLCSVGQVRLMEIWTELFGLYDIHVGQILLTRSDFSNREPYLNIRDTLHAMLDHRILPICNENDPVANKKSLVGDNDNLGAFIANMIAADLFVILTDQKGLYDKDPRTNPDAKLISIVKTINDEVVEAAKDTSTKLGTGGMATKIEAAQLASHSGTPTEITSMSVPDVLLKLAKGEMAGTRFAATESTRESRKRWLLSEKSKGKVVVDPGAAQKLKTGGASLLPIGITATGGKFDRGALIQISKNGKVLGVGISNYSSAEIEKIKKTHSEKIEEVLGYTFGPEVIHRDNMVIL
jgi:glutamate 5-kinase